MADVTFTLNGFVPASHPAARQAAEAVGSNCAVLLAINSDNDTFEVYLHGKTVGQRVLAGALADITLEALQKSDPPEGLEQALKMISSAPQGQA